MSILNQILEKLELDPSGSMSDEAAEANSLIARQPPTDPTPTSNAGVVTKLEQLRARSSLNWKHSIVDLLKLLKINSSLRTRKALAQELGYRTGRMSAAAKSQMDTWLHKMVLMKIAEKGGNIPSELLFGEISVSQSPLAQTTQIIINGNPNPDSNYITWSPVATEIRLADTGGSTQLLVIKLRNQNPNQGGQVVFFTPFPGPGKFDHGQDELILALPPDGTPVSFFIAGKYGKPSLADKDAVIEVVDISTGNVLSVTPLMVRIRKNANSLEAGERQRFLSAMASLIRASTGGVGGFADYANVHADAGVREAHSNAGFLPWHRAFLLDLERELQALDPSVSLPYWRFDEAAPNLFTKTFIGVPNPTGTVEFDTNNPLQFLSPPLFRQPRFDTATQSAFVSSELDTLNLGDVFSSYRSLEGDPHGFAHTSFSGLLSNIGTAAKDPLFFLLHANVDRLWAKWQWLRRRFDLTSMDTYPFLGRAGDPGATRIGHNLMDTMWPWNQITGTGIGDDRPPTAPGGNLPQSKVVNFPGLTPMVGDMIDSQGILNPANRLGFDYDDVPFDFNVR